MVDDGLPLLRLKLSQASLAAPRQVLDVGVHPGPVDGKAGPALRPLLPQMTVMECCQRRPSKGLWDDKATPTYDQTLIDRQAVMHGPVLTYGLRQIVFG